MSSPQNHAAWLTKAGSPLEVLPATLPVPGPGEIVVKNAAVAINPIDCHMADIGIFVKEFPTILGADVAGEVYTVGPDVKGFKKGDRVIGHTINMVTGRPSDGAYAHYVIVPSNQAAILPDSISYTDGVVVPFALVAAVHALCNTVSGPAMPGVVTPAMGLPLPSLDAKSIRKTLLVYGGSSSVGSMTIQLAKAAGLCVIAISGPNNLSLCTTTGASAVFSHRDPDLPAKVTSAIKSSGNPLAGIVDPISTASSYGHTLAILASFSPDLKNSEPIWISGSHPPPAEVDIPANVQAGMFYAVSDIAEAVWKDFVSGALKEGTLKCLPKPLVVGRGLEFVQDGLRTSSAGVSGRKVVVEL